MTNQSVSNPTYFMAAVNGMEYLDLQNCIEQYQISKNEPLLSIILYKLRKTLRYYLYRKNNFSDKAELLAMFEDKLMECLDTYDSTKGVKFITYFSKCLNNVIINFYKSSQRHSRVFSIDSVFPDGNSDSTLADKLPTYEDDFDNMDSYLLLQQLRPKLSNNEYKVCEAILSETHSLQKIEIAEMIGLTPSAICYIIEKLKKRFQELDSMELV